jgi:hypothetical protein
MGRLEDRQKQMHRSTYPKINVDMYIDVRVEEGKTIPSFAYYDSENSKLKFTTKPIKGILIGEVMTVAGFSTSEEKYYKSSFYTNKTNAIVLLKEGQVAFKGTADQAADWLVTIKKTNAPSKRKVFLVLTEKGLIAVSTNMIIAIDQIRVVKRKSNDIFVFNFIELNPKRYDPNDTTLSADTHKRLKITAANKNYPYYASVSVGAKITEQNLTDYNEADRMVEYTTWLDYINKGGVSVTDHVETKSNESENQSNEASSAAATEDNINYEENFEDDLPF